jgi:AhpD family alkylhydroperoxidase
MRRPEIERGDGFANRLLINFISMVSGMRLPDATRVVFYHKDFFGVPMDVWTQAAMRGPSPWRVAERELMACMVAKWNACAFCVGAHGAVAAKESNAHLESHLDQMTVAAPAIIATVGRIELCLATWIPYRDGIGGCAFPATTDFRRFGKGIRTSDLFD